MRPQKKITKPSLETLELSSEKKITCMEVMGKQCFRGNSQGEGLKLHRHMRHGNGIKKILGHAGPVLGMIRGHKSTCELRSRIKVVEERELIIGVHARLQRQR